MTTPVLGDDVWAALIDRGKLTVEREVLSGRVVATFDCLAHADLDHSAFVYLDDGESGCVRCSAVFPRELILDLLQIGPRNARQN